MLDPRIARGLLIDSQSAAHEEDLGKEAGFNPIAGLTRFANTLTGMVPGGSKFIGATGGTVAEGAAKNISTLGNTLMAAGGVAGAGVGALTAGEGNRLGGAMQGGMIGLAPGLLVKGRAAAIRKNMPAQQTAVSKSGGPAAPTANNPTSGT